ncbi:hypothetical protein LTR62_001690 [Meristemomyces frigidus]|uniref:Actin-like ATPase domain-containing protein n=1 Tax=Meristemomyces frigidus TaxID=1508187 RepID=A0AAN7T873_9PEZI|nr:hypothetical protein LTR62_001690 [Meristemomyces frigidus]
MPRPSLAADDFFVIGIDFGTTYSGVAWCWSGQPENVELITRWKSKLSSFTSDNAKTPTTIYYDPVSTDKSWGYDVPIDVEPLSWFKLLLIDNDRLPLEFQKSGQIRRARELLKATGKTLVQVIADYLRLLWQHTIEELIRDRGDAAVNGSPFKVWITVPAIWNSKAQSKMLEAARMAGILDKRTAGKTEVEFVAEPEAAALAVLNDFKGRPDIKPGDVFVVCDAGGGTVDLISYEILSVDPLMVRECVEGKGKMCGAIFVDEAFTSLVKNALGGKWERMAIKSQKTMLHNEWENGIKKLYSDGNREWTVTVPPEAFDSKLPKLHRFDDKKSEVPLKAGQLVFQRGHIRGIFDVVLPQIRSLIRDQVTAVTEEKKGITPKAILLVGGLGACNYLYQELRIEYRATSKTQAKAVDVLQPSGARPWTAICRGAVIRGLSATPVGSEKGSLVVARVSRLSYGIVFMSGWDDSLYEQQDKYWCTQEMAWKADNQMHWYLERGSDMHHKDPVSFRYYQLYSRPLSNGLFQIDVLKDDSASPPRRKTDSVTAEAHITVHLETPFEELPEYTNSVGEKFRQVRYTITMLSCGTSMQWKVFVNGKVVGSENVVVAQSDD